MTFKEYLAEIASSMPPGAINPSSTPTGRLPNMPTDNKGNSLGGPLGEKDKKEITGGPFSVGRHILNRTRLPGLSGAGKDKEPEPGPFTFNIFKAPPIGPQQPNLGKKSEPIKKPLS